MGLSKVYRGYVIEDVNGQWYIRNAPNYLNGFPFNPGPHGGWTVATHQVDKLHDYLARNESSNHQNDMDRGKYVPRESPREEFVHSGEGASFFEVVFFLIFLVGFTIFVFS